MSVLTPAVPRRTTARRGLVRCLWPILRRPQVPGCSCSRRRTPSRQPGSPRSPPASSLEDLSAQFHGYLRALPAHPRSLRPVNLNVWEAVYFRHDFGTLAALAGIAAGIGAERYVLDDGWFRGRRTDQAGLGDWHVDDDVWPGGFASARRLRTRPRPAVRPVDRARDGQPRPLPRPPRLDPRRWPAAAAAAAASARP